MTRQPTFIDDLLLALPESTALHRRSSKTYDMLAKETRRHIVDLFSGKSGDPQPFGPFGDLRFPYQSMGNIDSLDLFGLDELIILSFYWQNRNRYAQVADLGTNLGLHTIAMGRAGFDVKCFEPDPDTHALLLENLERNAIRSVEPNMAAVSVEDGESEFVRVNGNRTGSHLAGAKANPYGDLERFPVKMMAFRPIAEWADLMKIDVEGHEVALIEVTDYDLWCGVDAMMEVGTPDNAKAVYAHLAKIGVNMFAQKIGWKQVHSVDDIPVGHQEGSLFVTTKPEMPWA